MLRFRVSTLTIAAVAIAVGGCTVNVPPSPPMAPTAQNNAQTAQGGTMLQAAGVSGIPLQVYFGTAINPDCSSMGDIVFSVKVPPAHGKVVFQRAAQFPNFTKDNQRYKCNEQRLPGTAVIYTSDKDYSGDDQFTVNLVTPVGQLVTFRYLVKIQAPN